MVFKLLAIDKWARLMRIISKNGGLVASVLRLWKTDTLKEGVLVGKDAFGNTYYENPFYMIGRSRWVVFSPTVNFEYDASQITSEWFGWIHYRTDRKPHQDCAKYGVKCCPCTQRWLLPYEENVTGTPAAYYPYSTIRDTISVWDGTNTCDRKQCAKVAEEAASIKKANISSPCTPSV